MPLECRALEFYAQTIAAIRLRGTIDNIRVLRKFANQGVSSGTSSDRQYRLVSTRAPWGLTSSVTVRSRTPRLIQVGEVELNRQRLALLHSRIETLQTRNLPLRTAMTYLPAYVLHGLDGRHSFCRLHGLSPAQVLKARRNGQSQEGKVPSLECQHLAPPLTLRGNGGQINSIDRSGWQAREKL